MSGRPAVEPEALGGPLVSRIVLNDFAGHAFMVDLAVAMQRSGTDVVYDYCDTNLSPHGDFDTAPVPIEAISTREPIREVQRVTTSIGRTRVWMGIGPRPLRRQRADVVILNNFPLLSLIAPLLVGRLIGAQRIIWLQDVQSGLVAGVTGKRGVAARVAQWVEGFALRRADVSSRSPMTSRRRRACSGFGLTDFTSSRTGRPYRTSPSGSRQFVEPTARAERSPAPGVQRNARPQALARGLVDARDRVCPRPT